MISQNELTVLVVGQPEENRHVARWMLNRAFPRVVVLEAADDDQLQRLCADERIDCILVDEDLDDADRLLNSLALKAQAHVPVIAMAESDNMEFRTKALDRGVEHCLMKDHISAASVELVVEKAIDIASLRLMIDEQGRELERMRVDLEQIRSREQAAPEQSTRSKQVSLTDETVVDEPIPDLSDDPEDDSESKLENSAGVWEAPDPWPPKSPDAGSLLVTSSVGSPSSAPIRPKLLPNLAGVTTQDQEIAARVQKELLPPGAPAIEGFDIAGISIPASKTGGDYYDYLPVADDLLTITIGECSGEGFAPAMLMASLRAYLRVISSTTMDVEETISQANRFISEDISQEEFLVTLVVAQIDQLTRTIRYASAGQQAHVLDRNGQVDVLPSSGMPMGLQHDTLIPEGEPRKLKTGDIVLLSTDGVQKIRSSSGEAFGTDRMLDIVAKNRNLPARMIVNFLQKECSEFGDKVQADDLTFVVVKCDTMNYL